MFEFVPGLPIRHSRIPYPKFRLASPAFSNPTKFLSQFYPDFPTRLDSLVQSKYSPGYDPGRPDQCCRDSDSGVKSLTLESKAPWLMNCWLFYSFLIHLLKTCFFTPKFHSKTFETEIWRWENCKIMPEGWDFFPVPFKKIINSFMQNLATFFNFVFL